MAWDWGRAPSPIPLSGEVSAFGHDHDVCSFDEGGRLLAGFEAELVGALAGDECHQVVVPDLEGHFGRRLSLHDLRDGAGQTVTGAEGHLVLLAVAGRGAGVWSCESKPMGVRM